MHGTGKVNLWLWMEKSSCKIAFWDWFRENSVLIEKTSAFLVQICLAVETVR